MPSRFEPPAGPTTPEPDDKQIDINKRYDVYCSQWQHRIVCFRNARFRQIKELYRKQQFDTFCEYMELEQENGQAVFIMRSHVIMFCEAGTELKMDVIASKI